MSNLCDLPSVRPIEKVGGKVEDIERIMNTIKFDIGVIKSDLDVIKTIIKTKEEAEKKKEISRGWLLWA